MTAPLSSPSACPSTADPAVAGGLVYRDVLDELIEIGMGLARRMAAVPVLDGPEVACIVSAAFEQVSRAVRRTVRLAQWLANAPAVRPSVPDRATARAQIRRGLEDHLAWGEHVGRGGDGLQAEMLERLEGLDVVEALDRGRPVAEIIEEIRADLGLLGVQQHRRRTPADVAVLHSWARQTAEGQAGVPGGPRHDWVGYTPDAGRGEPEGGDGLGREWMDTS